MKDLDETFGSLSKGFVKDYTDLLAYRTSFQLSKEIFETTKQFPREEIYARSLLTAYCLLLTAYC